MEGKKKSGKIPTPEEKDLEYNHLNIGRNRHFWLLLRLIYGFASQ